jgi:hypothetical protein
MFGDADPEDGYDAGDTAREKVVVLVRLLVELEANPADGRDGARVLWALRVIRALRDIGDPELLERLAVRFGRL